MVVQWLRKRTAVTEAAPAAPPSADAPTPPVPYPAEAGYGMPAEWAPHLRTWMEWPCRPETFGGEVETARDAYAAVAKAISRFEPVTVITRPDNVASVSLACGGGVNILSMDHDDAWMRDNGPTFLTRDDGLVAGVAWGWNAWGRQYKDFQRDAKVGRALLEHLGLPVFDAPLVMEGGSFHTDGEGTLLVTEQCLLNPNRNPDLSRADIETALKRYLGVVKVIWLGNGLEDDETDGHVDNVACFARPGVVLVHGVTDKTDPDQAVMADNVARLQAATDAAGRALDIIPVDAPRRRRRTEQGRRMTTSYINFYICNGGIVAPMFEDANDRKALDILSRAFPGRDVVQVPVLDILEGGGGIHCITKQQPAVAA